MEIREGELLKFPHKMIRSGVIRKYIGGNRDKVVCFSCGNAARALANEGLDVLHIGEEGVLTPNKWFSQREIAYWFGDYFDGTSGHLSVELMQIIGEAYKEFLGDLPELVYLPTGSGETLVCLKMAYPNTDFVAVYNLGKETEYNENAPLNRLVELLSYDIIFADEEKVIKDEQ